MEGEDGIPVGATEEATWAEGGGLDEFLFIDFELEPGFTGHFHLGDEDEAGGFVVGAWVGEDDAPEIEGIADVEFGGVAAAASEADAAGEAIHPAAEFPSPVHGGPAFGSAEGPDGGDGFCAGGGQGDALLVRKDSVGGDLDGLEEGGV